MHTVYTVKLATGRRVNLPRTFDRGSYAQEGLVQGSFEPAQYATSCTLNRT
jgi:hypothetical protein